MPTSPNRAYLATMISTFAKILLRRTSDTLGTLYAIVNKRLNTNGHNTRKRNLGEPRRVIRW